jgi:vacuolar-type H+-ATPase subunit F/Vma7
MKTIIFLVPPDVQFGFNLAGIREQVCHLNTASDTNAVVSSQILQSSTGLEQTIRGLMSDEQVGVIVIDERLMNHHHAEDLHALEKNWRGLLVVLPAPRFEEAAQEDYTMQLIQKAIGYHVRLSG